MFPSPASFLFSDERRELSFRGSSARRCQIGASLTSSYGGGSMFRALKDGLKEFANDALKESAEIVKDTADGTAKAAKATKERLGELGETLRVAGEGASGSREDERGSAALDAGPSRSPPFASSVARSSPPVKTRAGREANRAKKATKGAALRAEVAATEARAAAPHPPSAHASSTASVTAAIEAASRAAEDAVAAADAPTASGPVLLPPSETSSELIPLSRGDPSGLELVVRELQASLREALGAKVAAETDARCLLYTSPSPRDQRGSRMPSSA